MDIEAERDKWKIMDGDYREDGEGLITYHCAAFDEGYIAGHAALAAPQQSVPFAWFRTVQCGGSPGDPVECDFDIDYSENQPTYGSGWSPLYLGYSPNQPPPAAPVLSDEAIAALKELIAAIDYTGMDCQDRFDCAEHAARALLAKVRPEKSDV